jgi:hypothetical protein
MKIRLFSIASLLLLNYAAGDVVLKAAPTDKPYEVVISIVNEGKEPVAFNFTSPEKFSNFHTWSPFHWKIESKSTVMFNKGYHLVPVGGWWTIHTMSSRAYIGDEWQALFETRILQPSEKIDYTGDLRKIMANVDWENMEGEFQIEFKYPFFDNSSGDKKSSPVSSPLKLKL